LLHSQTDSCAEARPAIAERKRLKNVKAIILGANRGVSRLDCTKSHPHALTEDSHGRSVLHWQLSAFRELGIEDIVFVGGHHIEKIIQSYPDLKFYYNPEWQSSGTLRSLFCAERELEGPCLISCADVVYRTPVIEKLLLGNGRSKIALAIDTSDKDDLLELSASGQIEDVEEEQGEIKRIGMNLASAADARRSGCFIGLCYLDADGIESLKKAYHQAKGRFPGTASYRGKRFAEAGIADLIQYLVELGEGVSAIPIGEDWAKIQDAASLRRFVFGTKAQTLENLQSLIKSAKILEQCRFRVLEWRKDPERVLDRIQDEIAADRIVIRSSALNEDTWSTSRAGAYHSEIDVNVKDRRALKQGITNVIRSYRAKSADVDLDEVFVQPYVADSKMSGVLFTRELDHGAPYYVINYTNQNGRTDLVTAGAAGQLNTEIVYRNAKRGNGDPNIARLIHLAKELEEATHHDSLDIEFAIDQENECFLFQVRPMAGHAKGRQVEDHDVEAELQCARQFMSNLLKRRPHLHGETTILAEMPDWNPAEIIGSTPRPLALSLYQYLITDTVWGRSRKATGYKDTYPEPLVVSFVGRPYVDCRASFNSFLPVTLDPDLSERLVDHYLETLRGNPELHDKVEFEVAITCFTFDFDLHSARLLAAGFNRHDISALKSSLLHLTNEILNERVMTTQDQLVQIKRLSERRSRWTEAASGDKDDSLRSIRYLLDDCIQYGTLPFSNLARFAFVGTTFLKSLKRAGVLSEAEYDGFLMSIPTVASEIVEDMNGVTGDSPSADSFLARYGHLRPGTYDILSPRYDERPDLYLFGSSEGTVAEAFGTRERVGAREFVAEKMETIESLLAESLLECSAERLVDFICLSMQAREYAKFEFTKNLSDALKWLGIYGESLGLTRDDLSFVPIQSFLNLAVNSPSSIMKQEIERIAGRNRKRYEITRAVQLPSLITSTRDVESFRYNSVRPNFITSGKVCAELVNLAEAQGGSHLEGKIVLIENADPGYDWIFGHRIAGMITKYGGVASHMSIRAAEFGLPSVIGCGEVLFRRMLHAKRVELNCATQQIHVIE